MNKMGVMLELARRWTVNPVTLMGGKFESFYSHNTILLASCVSMVSPKEILIIRFKRIVYFCENSSVGLERLPSKQEVAGSRPVFRSKYPSVCRERATFVSVNNRARIPN